MRDHIPRDSILRDPMPDDDDAMHDHRAGEAHHDEGGEPGGADDATLPGWMVTALRAPLDLAPGATAAAQARVMARVRQAPRHRLRLLPGRPRWARRGVLAPGGAAAAALALLLAGGIARVGTARGAGGETAAATVLRDTVVARVRFGGALSGALGPALSAAMRDTVLDTLRLVRFVLHAPAAREVALAGDFNAWHAGATPLARAGRGGAWVATVTVPRDAVRYAFVVDGRRWIAGPPPMPDLDAHGAARADGDSI